MPLLTFLKLFKNIFLVFLIPAYIFSNKDFEFDGNLRNRIEYQSGFDINQFYLKYNFLKKFELKAGRQSISFGDRRIFGPGEWGNTGRYIWDAIKLKYENKNFESNLIYGSYVMHNPDLFPNKRVKNAYAIGSYNTYLQTPCKKRKQQSA